MKVTSPYRAVLRPGATFYLLLCDAFETMATDTQCWRQR